MIKVLLRAGAKIDALDKKPRATALGTAAFALRNEAVTTLVEAGARLKDTEFDRHAIHMATIAQNLGIVKDLIFAGADLEVGYPADLNRTPLHLAVAYGITAVAQHLLRAGAKTNVTDALGCSPLYSASYVGHVQCAIDLLSSGADMMIMNSDGNSALEACCQEGHVAVVKELIRHGVLRASPRSTSAWVAFVSLVAAARSGRTEVADVLMKAGVPPVQEGLVRSGPLSSAAMAGKLQVCFFLSSFLVRTNGDILGGTAIDTRGPRNVVFLKYVCLVLRPPFAARSRANACSHPCSTMDFVYTYARWPAAFSRRPQLSTSETLTAARLSFGPRNRFALALWRSCWLREPTTPSGTPR